MKRIILAAALLPVAVLAKDSRWTSTSDSSWENDGNWTNGAPGSDSDDTNLDGAYFRENVQTSVLLASDRYLGKIQFQSNGGNAGSFTIGETNGPAIHLCNTANTYDVTCNAGNTPGIVNTIAAPLQIYSIYQFLSQSTDPSSILVLNGISCGRPDVSVGVQLKGGNRGENMVLGPVENGLGTVEVIKLNDGCWILRGDNTYTGNTTIYGGTLIAGDDVPATGAGPFGNASVNKVRLGQPNPNSASTATPVFLLAGTRPDGEPVTFARNYEVQANNKEATWPQPIILGGANTAGTTRFTGDISNYRPLNLACATGGRCSFEGSWASVRSNRGTICIGWDGMDGTVSLVSNLSAQSGLIVSNGTLEVNGSVTTPFDVPVSAGATVRGAGTLNTNLVAEAGAILSGGTNGVGTLTINGNATLASGAILSLPATDTDAPFLSVTGELSLDGAMLQTERFAADPVRRIAAVHAEGGIVGTPDLSALPKVCAVDITETDIVLSFKQPTILLIL